MKAVNSVHRIQNIKNYYTFVAMRKGIAFFNTFCKSLFFLSEKTANLKKKPERNKPEHHVYSYVVGWFILVSVTSRSPSDG